MDRQKMLEEIEIKLWCRTKVSSYKVDLFNIKDVWEVILEDFVTPVSLSRVLSALGHWYWYDFSNQMIMFMKDSFIDGIYWYLLKEDKSDAYLDDQSDETIKAIREIICKCDHVGDWVAYMTNPAQYKCKKCWEMFK